MLSDLASIVIRAVMTVRDATIALAVMRTIHVRDSIARPVRGLIPRDPLVLANPTTQSRRGPHHALAGRLVSVDVTEASPHCLVGTLGAVRT